MSKSIMELIQKRKSVRSYTNDLLSSTLVEELKHYILICQLLLVFKPELNG